MCVCVVCVSECERESVSKRPGLPPSLTDGCTRTQTQAEILAQTHRHTDTHVYTDTHVHTHTHRDRDSDRDRDRDKDRDTDPYTETKIVGGGRVSTNSHGGEQRDKRERGGWR